MHSDFDFKSGYQTENRPAGEQIGAIAGIRRQYGNVVGGIEINADFSNFKGNDLCPNNKFQCRTIVAGLESVRGELGYAAGRWLVYGTAGLALEQVTDEAIQTSDLSVDGTTGQRSKRGWVAGLGVESALSSRVSIGAQFLHYDFGKDNSSFTRPSDGSFRGNADFTDAVDVVEARISFKFDGSDHHTPLK